MSTATGMLILALLLAVGAGWYVWMGQHQHAKKIR